MLQTAIDPTLQHIASHPPSFPSPTVIIFYAATALTIVTHSLPTKQETPFIQWTSALIGRWRKRRRTSPNDFAHTHLRICRPSSQVVLPITLQRSRRQPSQLQRSLIRGRTQPHTAVTDDDDDDDTAIASPRKISLPTSHPFIRSPILRRSNVISTANILLNRRTYLLLSLVIQGLSPRKSREILNESSST